MSENNLGDYHGIKMLRLASMQRLITNRFVMNAITIALESNEAPAHLI